MLLTGCAHSFPGYPLDTGIYMYRFFSFYRVQPDVKVEMIDVIDFKDSGVVGICYEGQALVKLKISYWNKATDYEKEQLLFHELGHCLFAMEHDDTINKKLLIPNSLMNSNMIDEDIYSAFHSYYIEEFREKIEEAIDEK